MFVFAFAIRFAFVFAFAFMSKLELRLPLALVSESGLSLLLLASSELTLRLELVLLLELALWFSFSFFLDFSLEPLQPESYSTMLFGWSEEAETFSLLALLSAVILHVLASSEKTLETTTSSAKDHWRSIMYTWRYNWGAVSMWRNHVNL